MWLTPYYTVVVLIPHSHCWFPLPSLPAVVLILTPVDYWLDGLDGHVTEPCPRTVCCGGEQVITHYYGYWLNVIDYWQWHCYCCVITVQLFCITFPLPNIPDERTCWLLLLWTLLWLRLTALWPGYIVVNLLDPSFGDWWRLFIVPDCLFWPSALLFIVVLTTIYIIEPSYYRFVVYCPDWRTHPGDDVNLPTTYPITLWWTPLNRALFPLQVVFVDSPRTYPSPHQWPDSQWQFPLDCHLLPARWYYYRCWRQTQLPVPRTWPAPRYWCSARFCWRTSWLTPMPVGLTPDGILPACITDWRQRARWTPQPPQAKLTFPPNCPHYFIIPTDRTFDWTPHSHYITETAWPPYSTGGWPRSHWGSRTLWLYWWHCAVNPFC